MTLEELNETLPNGLHDARIKSMNHDYVQAVVNLQVEILFGLQDDPPEERFRYRNGTIHFHRVAFCTVEIPENERILVHPGSIWFVFSRIAKDVLAEKITKSLPEQTLCYSLYILDWESEIRIAAGDVTFSWEQAD